MCLFNVLFSIIVRVAPLEGSLIADAALLRTTVLYYVGRFHVVKVL